MDAATKSGVASQPTFGVKVGFSNKSEREGDKGSKDRLKKWHGVVGGTSRSDVEREYPGIFKGNF